MKPIPFMCVPTVSRTVSTVWPTRSPSWTPVWRRVSDNLTLLRLTCIFFAKTLNRINRWYCIPNFQLCHSFSQVLHSIWNLSCCFAVSLQDINMRKAFKSSTIQNQKVLSKGSTPSSVSDLYNNSDRPPPLSTLTAYRYCMCCLMSFDSELTVSFLIVICFFNAERIPLTPWNTTLTRHTSLTCGRRRCFRTQRKRGKRGGGKEWEHTSNNCWCFFSLFFYICI